MTAMNRVQFQAGLSMTEFSERYGTEEKCHAALEASRWPSGFCCPACRDERHSRFVREGRTYWQCHRCRNQSTVISGTIFQATKLPLNRWFLAMHLLTQAKNNVSALELMRHLGVCYKTAWLVKHKLLEVMTRREDGRVLEGRVEIDDAYLGGERPGTRGRGSENKISFLAAVQTSADGRPMFLSLKRLPFTKEAIAAWANQSLATSTYALSDGLKCFGALKTTVAHHDVHVMGGGREAVKHPAFRWVNTLLGNLKTSISGTYHAFKFAKYADRYLGEAQYRFNRRFDLSSILARLTRAATLTTPQPMPKIRLAEECR